MFRSVYALAALTAVSALTLAEPAAAQAISAEAKVTAGRLTRIAMHSDVGPGCVATSAPQINITKKPRNGTVQLINAKVVRKTGDCAGKQVPVQDVLYKARAGARSDEVGYEIAGTNSPRKVLVKIKVMPAEKRAAQ